MYSGRKETSGMGGRNRKEMGNREGLQQEDARKLWGDDINTHYLDCVDGFTAVYICHNL